MRIQFAYGLNNGVLYIKKGDWPWYSELGFQSDWVGTQCHNKENWDYWTKTVDTSRLL